MIFFSWSEKQMSSRQFLKVPHQIIKSGKDLTACEFRVLCVIRSYDPSYPGIRRISLNSGISKTTVMDCVNSLNKKGYINRVKGRGKSNFYVRTDKW